MAHYSVNANSKSSTGSFMTCKYVDTNSPEQQVIYINNTTDSASICNDSHSQDISSTPIHDLNSSCSNSSQTIEAAPISSHKHSSQIIVDQCYESHTVMPEHHGQYSGKNSSSISFSSSTAASQGKINSNSLHNSNPRLPASSFSSSTQKIIKTEPVSGHLLPLRNDRNGLTRTVMNGGSVPSNILLQLISLNAEKENLLGQLLKASEHCEPASLIPAGVVNDVIPAVGYRIVEVSNLCEMIRSMHVCSSGSNIPGAIAIQEQASLREGAVSQLSVICTSCQIGTVCPTSNRVALLDEDVNKTPVTEEGPWDINVRVHQLVQEFGLSENQVQRMLEILGIFYRPCNVTSEQSLPALHPSGPLDAIPFPRPVEGCTAMESALIRRQETVPCNKAALKLDAAKASAVSESQTQQDSSSSKKKSKSSSLPKPKNIACDKCDAKFVSMNHYKKHAQSHNVAQHTCPYCHSYFKKPYNLKEHIKKHQNVKYKCDLCPSEFTDRSSLVSHKKSSHEKRFKYQCSECNKVFFRRVHFTDHMRLHTRETPFVCEICGKRFIWRDSVKKHMETHTAEAKYNCRLCGKWFRWLQSVRQHLQQQHKLKKCDVEAQVRTSNPPQTSKNVDGGAEEEGNLIRPVATRPKWAASKSPGG